MGNISTFLRVLPVFLLLLASGCQITEINDAAIVMGIGVDWDQNQIISSVQLAQPAPSGQVTSSSMPPFIVLTGKGRDISESLRAINLSFPRRLLLSQSGLLILGEGLARKDLALFADSCFRNPDFRKNAILVVARGATPSEILEVKPPLESFSAQAVPKMLRVQERQLGIYQSVTLEDFLTALTNPGFQPVAPLVTIKQVANAPMITLDGTAVFKDRQMIGALNARESRGLRWMKPGMISGGIITITSPLNTDTLVVMEIIRSEAKIKAEIENRQITMKIEINAEGNFYEQVRQANILTLKNVPVLEELTAGEIKNDIASCIKKTQQLNSDILGWGRLVQDKDPRLWGELKGDWDRVFPEINTDIRVKFAMRRTYLSNKSFQYK